MQKICGRGSTGLRSLWRLPRSVEAVVESGRAVVSVGSYLRLEGRCSQSELYGGVGAFESGASYKIIFC